MMESFATMINCFELLTIVAKLLILDVCEVPSYASDSEEVGRRCYTEKLIWKVL